MNRSLIVSIAVGLGIFAIAYVLPLLGLNLAIDQGWYAAVALPIAGSLTAPRAFWVDEDGSEHEMTSITPHSSWSDWLLVRFVNPDMDTSLVQKRHVVVRTPGATVQPAN